MTGTNSRADSPADKNRDQAGKPGEDLLDDGTDSGPTEAKAPSNLAEALDVSGESPDDGGAPQGVKA